jgi:hypothetical protein
MLIGHYDWERVGTMHARDEEHHIYWCPRCGTVQNTVLKSPADPSRDGKENEG